MPLPGVYPASVTPFDAGGKIDFVSLARLLAWFEAAGCKGAVLAGTNGEGPSLSAAEKRDLLRGAKALSGSLDLILGVATPSLTEAIWLSRQAAENGASAILLMPPAAYRGASESGIENWLLKVMDESEVPVLVYNFPKMTGFAISTEMMGTLMVHPKAAGLKDSSGERANLKGYRAATPDGRVLYVGDETLLLGALESGWSGSISGASNVVPQWMSTIVREWVDPAARESAETKFAVLKPVVEAIRGASQPTTHKAILTNWSILERPDVRLPLSPADPEDVERITILLHDRLGIGPQALGL